VEIGWSLMLRRWFKIKTLYSQYNWLSMSKVLGIDILVVE